MTPADSPLVTIGIPAYNAGRYIGLAVRSVLTQTFTDFELIITDDGSTDHTIAEARAAAGADPRATILSDGHNRGISARLNQQISLARGRYFCRMDADDIMFPDRLQRQIDFIRATGADVIGSPAVVIDENNNIIGWRPSAQSASPSFIHPTVMGTTEYFRKWGYDSRYDGCEDVHLWKRSLPRSKATAMDTPVLFYRDPLKIRLSVYNRRRVTSIRVRVKLWRDGLLPLSTLIKDIGLGVTKFITYNLASLASLDGRILQRRNSPCPDQARYNTFLQQVIQLDS